MDGYTIIPYLPAEESSPGGRQPLGSSLYRASQRAAGPLSFESLGEWSGLAGVLFLPARGSINRRVLMSALFRYRVLFDWTTNVLIWERVL